VQCCFAELNRCDCALEVNSRRALRDAAAIQHQTTGADEVSRQRRPRLSPPFSHAPASASCCGRTRHRTHLHFLSGSTARHAIHSLFSRRTRLINRLDGTETTITTTPQPFYGPFSGTTRVRRCQKRTSGLYGAREDGTEMEHVIRRYKDGAGIATENFSVFFLIQMH